MCDIIFLLIIYIAFQIIWTTVGMLSIIIYNYYNNEHLPLPNINEVFHLHKVFMNLINLLNWDFEFNYYIG